MYTLPSVISFLGDQPIQRRRSSLIHGVSPEPDNIVEEVNNDDKTNVVKCSEHLSEKTVKEERLNLLRNDPPGRESVAECRRGGEAITEDDDDIGPVHPPQVRVIQVSQAMSYSPPSPRLCHIVGLIVSVVLSIEQVCG